MSIVYQNNFDVTLDLGGAWADNAGSNWSVPSGGTAGFVRSQATGGFQWLITTTAAHAAIDNARVSAIRVANASIEGGLLVRFSGTSGAENCYLVDSYSTNTHDLYRFVSGAGTLLTSISNAFTNGDKISLQAVTVGSDAVLSLYLNDAQIGSNFTDSAAPILTAGQTGLATFAPGNIDFDAFLVETASAGGPSPGPLFFRRQQHFVNDVVWQA
jgi:hypothetical protein